MYNALQEILSETLMPTDILSKDLKNSDKKITIRSLEEDYAISTYIKETIVNQNHETFKNLDSRIGLLEDKDIEKDLSEKSLVNEIKHLLSQSKRSNIFNQKVNYLNNLKHYLKRYINDSENIFNIKTQSISVILDCINYNKPDQIFDKAIETLLEILDSIIIQSMTQEKLEFYVEKLYKKGLKLFGNKSTNDIKNSFPSEFQDIFNNI